LAGWGQLPTPPYQESKPLWGGEGRHLGGEEEG